jgi:glycosyltransferase involved in cell wall biosynthesis
MMNISVVIPLYNKKETVIRTINSVLAQTYLPQEIIVVNDGSTDASAQLVESLNHPVIKLIHQANAGVSAARNTGIVEAKGEWLAFLDADDEWKPTFLETIQLLAQTYPQCKVLATAYELQDYKGTRKPIILNKIPFNDQQGILNNYFEVAACSHPPLWSSAVVADKKALQSIGVFPVGIKSGEDLLTWARLAVKNEIAYSLKSLAVFIQDAAHTYDDRPNRIPESLDLVGNELIKLSNGNPHHSALKYYVSHWFKMRASIFLRLGMSKNAIKATWKSLTYNPGNGKVYIYIILAILPLKVRHSIFKKFGA